MEGDSLFGLGLLAAQGEASPARLGISRVETPDVVWGQQQEAPLPGVGGAASGVSGVDGQPGGQVGRALEVEQGVGQGFQLIHW